MLKQRDLSGFKTLPATTRLEDSVKQLQFRCIRHYGRVVKATDSNCWAICFPLGAQVQILLVSFLFDFQPSFANV